MIIRSTNEAADFPLAKYIHAARAWSTKTFGPKYRKAALVAHIRKELVEIEDASRDEVLGEWIDVIILALDGAWRSGANPEQIVTALINKFAINKGRDWPDWRTVAENLPIEHERSEEEEPAIAITDKGAAYIAAAEKESPLVVEELAPQVPDAPQVVEEPPKGNGSVVGRGRGRGRR